MEFLLNFESSILLFIQEYIRQEWMDPFWTFITSLGDSGWFWLALSILLMIPKKTRKIGFTALVAVTIGALFTNVILKNMVGRIRPYEVINGLNILIERQHDFSFPSGHTCASFAAALVYYRLCPRKWGIPLVILASLIAFSRLYVGVHYPSDVLVGFAIGAFAAWLAVRIVNRVIDKRKVKRKV